MADLPASPPAAPTAKQDQSVDPSLPAKTTYQEDMTTAGQRAINLIWETTQGKIAVYIMLGTMLTDMLVLAITIILGKDLTAAQALLVGVVNSLGTGVMSYYFSRTNHTQIGGVGNKPNEEYKGR